VQKAALRMTTDPAFPANKRKRFRVWEELENEKKSFICRTLLLNSQTAEWLANSTANQ
jgi:hypothetical protein